MMDFPDSCELGDALEKHEILCIIPQLEMEFQEMAGQKSVDLSEERHYDMRFFPTRESMGRVIISR